MRTSRTKYAVINRGIHPVYVYKDNRKMLDKPLKRPEQRGVSHMMYMVTVLVISSALMVCMKIADIYFDQVNANIQIDTMRVSKAAESIIDIIGYADPIIADNQIREIAVTNVAMSTIELEYVEPIDDTPATPPRAVLTPEQLEFVERVVEAEVTGTSYKWNGEYVDSEEMLKSKIRVCQVFLNRVDDTEEFDYITNLYDAVSYPNASSTVKSGRYLEVEVTDLTREAVQIALDPNTEDLTDGALYFLSGGATVNKYGDYMFTDKVGHSFFK